ncbi:MAG: hypothetical protein M1831_001429 [Alyxoria varia]|nr:MAG: hypothetical protein M1831_001429 [Alyxoria varia]
MMGLRKAWAIASSTILVAAIDNDIANDIQNRDVTPVVIPIVGGGNYNVYPAVPVPGTPNAYSVLAPPTAAVAQPLAPTNALPQDEALVLSGESGSQEPRLEGTEEVYPNPPTVAPPNPSPPNPSPAPQVPSAEVSEAQPTANPYPPNASPVPPVPVTSDFNPPVQVSSAADLVTASEGVISAPSALPVPVPSEPVSGVASSVAALPSDMTLAEGTLLPPVSPSSPSPSASEPTVTAAAASSSAEASRSRAQRSTVNTEDVTETSSGDSIVPTTVTTVTSNASGFSSTLSPTFATSTESETAETTTGGPPEASSAISTEAPVASEGAAPENVVSSLFGCFLAGLATLFLI